MTVPSADNALRVYWQPGCTSCLRTKEFLTRRGVPFLSRNVLADEGAFDELARFGLRQVPIVTRGDRWVNGQVLKDVAELAGIAYGAPIQHPPAELHRRLLRILDGAARFLGQIPEAQLATMLPGRPRSLLQLGYHLFNVADAFLEHEDGIPLTFASYCREPEPGSMSKAELLAYGLGVRERVAAWWAGPGQTADWSRRADVYYGQQTLHEFLERTTWHAGQHTRQLMWMMSESLALAPAQPLGIETFGDLPMPESVWDAA
ncbi:MAG: DinB family protein [Hyphomicrobiaceae bacterium]